MSQMKLGDGEAAGLPVNHPSQSIYLVGQMPDPAYVSRLEILVFPCTH